MVMELITLDQTFSTYELALFSEKMKTINCVSLTKEENEKLDNDINSFLNLLSPYFLLNPSGKALEWLIRRFDVQKFNIDSILTCILPYHETKAFVKMVSLLDIPENSPWVFLKPIRSTGIPLERDILVTRISKSRYILDFICKTVVYRKVAYSALYTFYAATLTSYIKSNQRISDAMAVALTPYLIDGLAAKKSPELQIATYMIISQLSSKALFNKEALETITSTMIKRGNQDLYRHSLLTLIHLAQTQANFSIPDDASKRLIDHETFGYIINDINATFNTEKFMNFIIPHLIASDKFSLVKVLLLNNHFSHDNIKLICDKTIDTYLELALNKNSENKKASQYLEQIQPLLVTLSQRFMEELDIVIEAKLKAAESNKSLSSALYELSSTAFRGTRHQLVQEAGTTLYLCLNNPSSSIRLLGLKKLHEVLNLDDSAFSQEPEVITSTLTDCLDEYGDLLRYVLQSMPDILLKYISADDIFSHLHKLLQQLGGYSNKQTIIIVNFLLTKFLSHHPSQETNVTQVLVTYILTLSNKEIASDASKMIKHVKLNSSTKLNTTLDHFKKSLKSVNPAYEFVKLEARSLGDVSFWTDIMVKSKDRAERTVGLFVLGHAVSISKGQQQYQLALALFKALSTVYPAGSQALYTTVLPDEYNYSKEDSLPLNVFQQYQVIHNINTELDVNLIQFTLLNIINSLNNEEVKSKQLSELLDELFKYFVSGPALGCFESMLTLTISTYLKENLLSFLVNHWTNTECNFIVRSRSLQICSSYIRSYASQHKVTDFQQLIPVILPSLNDKEVSVRNASLSCLKVIHSAYKSVGLPTSPTFYSSSKPKNTATTATKKPVALKAPIVYGTAVSIPDTRANDIAHFVDHIVHRQLEITKDTSYAKKLVKEYFTSCIESKQKSIKDSMNHILDLFLNHITSTPNIQLQVDLLSFLDDVDSLRMLEKLTGLLEQTLNTKRTDLNTRLIILLIRCCFTPSSGRKLEGAKLDIFARLLSNQDALHGEDENGWQVSTRRHALQQITDHFFTQTSDKAQNKILTLLIDITTNGEQYDVRLAKNVLMNITIPASILENYLNTFAKSLFSSEESEETRNPDPKAKKRARSNSVNTSKPVDLYELVTVIELIETTSTTNDILLIKPLFEVLTAMLNADLRNSPVSLEYINQLIMSALTRIIQAAEDNNVTVDETTLRVDVAVQCIRVSSNPQTHNQALLLMATIASMYPESVLHNIMPVFTFMGANVLRQDDNYSFQVIQQTLEKVIPPLVASHRLTSNNNAAMLALQVKPVIKVFVDALFHIPKHRQLRLFSVLIQTLGEDEFLATIVSLLLEKLIEKLASSARAEADSLMEFSIMISRQFSAQTQIKCLLSLLQRNLLDLPNEKPEDNNAVMEVDTIFNIQEHSAKQLRQFKLVNVNFINKILGSKQFLNRVLAISQSLDMLEDPMQPFFLEAVELVLKVVTYFTEFRDQYAVSENAHPTVTKFWRATLKVVYEVLDKLNALLPLHSFIEVISQLVHHPQVPIRRKAISIFNEKIAGFDRAPEDEELALVNMVSTLTTVIQEEKSKPTGDEEDQAINKQATLLCIGSLAKLLAHIHSTVFVDALPTIYGHECLQNANTQLKISSLVCISIIFKQVGPRAVPHLPKIMPIILNMLLLTVNAEKPNTMLQLSVISSLETIITTLPHFISPYLRDLLTGLLHKSLYEYDASDNQRALSHTKAVNVLSEMARAVPPRSLLNPVFSFYNDAVNNGKKSLLSLYSLITQAIQTMPRDIIINHYKQIFKFFLTAFDLRHNEKGKMTIEDINECEESIIGAFLELVMKLNETLFKPLFLKVMDWALVEDDNKSRTLFFYKLMDTLLERLKSIITPYVNYLIDDIIQRLTAYRDGTTPPNTLWIYLITTLRKSFLYDNDNLWSADKFNKIMDPVLDQLLVTEPTLLDGQDNDEDNEDDDNNVVIEPSQSYLYRMTTYVVPLVGQMAVTISNDTLWKPLNHKTLMKTREDDPEIRLAALRIIEEFYTRLGDEWLLFLAESISFLAELMEDDDVRVEKLVQQVNSLIESHLGESLDKYFN
ncbi:unnamed protein product [Cunninghamella echinulata]